MKRILLALAFVLWCASDGIAQYVTFSMSTYSFTFNAGDPDTTPTLTVGPVTVTYTILLSGGANWRLTAQATDNFRNGTSVIPASAMTWTGTPAPTFRAGTLSTSAAQTVASGNGDGLFDTGQVVFSIPNSWSYDVGTYTTSIVFTLTCP